MGKRKHSDSEGKKKKKKDDKKKKKGEKKKKVKKKKKEEKKVKKQTSSSSSSGNDSEELKAEGATVDKAPVNVSAVFLASLPPPEEGILRFEFSESEAGPLGLRFSPGFPPLILEVHAGSFAEKKGVPKTYVVHAVNGLLMIQSNVDHVMRGLKNRPMVLDVRPQGWKPQEMVMQRELLRQAQEAEDQAKIRAETVRREAMLEVIKKQDDQKAADLKKVLEMQKKQAAEAKQRMKDAKVEKILKEKEWEEALATDPADLREAANRMMEADYGSDVDFDGKRGLPLRLLTRRKEVAWLWAGETMELIGGGVQDQGDSWSQ